MPKFLGTFLAGFPGVNWTTSAVSQTSRSGGGTWRGDTPGPHVTRDPEDPLSGKSQLLVNVSRRGQRSKTVALAGCSGATVAPPPLNAHLHLVHVHDGLGGSLGAQPVADPLVQGHPVQLAVVGRPPPAGAADGGDTFSHTSRQVRASVASRLLLLVVVVTRSSLG